MSYPKLRNLGQFGVLTDPDPYDLPPQAFSLGVNARFRNGRVTRGPVFRSVKALGTASPRFLTSSNPTAGLDFVFVGYQSGKVYRYNAGSEVDYSIAGYVPNAVEATWTACHLADVFYINREDRIPWYFTQAGSQFIAMPAAWDSTYRCKLLRSCGGALVALNVTKGVTSYPTLVKTSSFALAGATPVSWDYTTPSTNATENILAELEGPIVDACAMRNDLFIYGSNETWLMTAVSGVQVFDYRKVFSNRGSLNANCSIEIDGKQYVFGVNDIWMHDGMTDVSICEGKVRDFIFSSINISKASSCFVEHNAQNKELHFCYVSGDRVTAFLGAGGCNRAAVYNYANGTWTFDDLPFVYSGARANIDQVLTYTSVTQTYDTIGSSYLEQEDSFKKVLCFVGDVSATYSLTASLYAFDPYDVGASVSYAVDVHATKGLYLERDGIDMDELDQDLRGYKQINSIFPQGRLGALAAPIEFQLGAADSFNQVPTFIDWQTYNGDDLYKLDFNAAGRYLSMRIRFNDYRYMSLSGLDLDLQVTAER